ncbi:hypothetical protein TUMSATVNIG1_60620 (plasmid) [Vibrio nigripulchritudo]|nr:hypothetical protein VNTUMSATTG_60150 [Vibrio nigripulchritudo]BDU35453.1 hypothetical protein TUMSATVNIG1_60620 [Vibrio nigripulchritudo]
MKNGSYALSPRRKVQIELANQSKNNKPTNESTSNHERIVSETRFFLLSQITHKKDLESGQISYS